VKRVSEESEGRNRVKRTEVKRVSKGVKRVNKNSEQREREERRCRVRKKEDD